MLNPAAAVTYEFCVGFVCPVYCVVFCLAVFHSAVLFLLLHHVLYVAMK